MIKLKRVYENPEPHDGKRILIDRLWPRGLRKESARLDEWLKDIAPSDELRKWYGHKENRWEEFRDRYRRELKQEPAASLVKKLRQEGKHQTVTLLYAAKDGAYSNAAVLLEVLKNG